MFFLSAAVLVIFVILFISWPLFRDSRRPLRQGMDTAVREESIDLEIEKQNILAYLTDLESDLQGGKLSQTDYEHLKDADEHRLAKILDKIDRAAADARRSDGIQASAAPRGSALRFRTMNTAGFVILILVIAGGASGIYYYQGSGLQSDHTEAMMEGQAGTAMDESANILEMVTRLERRLRENPDDLQGQIMAGRSYMTIQRDEDARIAWNKVLELDPSNVEAHYSLGYLLIQTTESGSLRHFEQAINHFDEALKSSPGLPAALYYKGVALTHLKRHDEAVVSWENALKGLPPGSEDAEFIKDALRKLKSGN